MTLVKMYKNNKYFLTLKTKFMISSLFWIVPISALTALLFAWIFYSGMKKEEEGTDKMKEIAEYVREGAMAYLKSHL
jgi:Na+/H+-translocating membrane pyrophosphatase